MGCGAQVFIQFTRALPPPRRILLVASGQPMIIDGPMFAKVKVDDCMWQLQDSHKLIVTLQKLIGDPPPLV